MNHLTVETGDALSSLLEVAANNDVEGFKRLIEDDPSGIDEVGLWYVRKKGSKQMVYEHRTPLMVAAMYGSLDVLTLILSLSITDVNRSCGEDKSTALHCAASGGSVDAVDAVKMLLQAGADPNAVDANGHRPFDVITVPPKQNEVKSSLEELLVGRDGSITERIFRVLTNTTTSNSNSPPLSSSPGNGSHSSSSGSPPSPMNLKFDGSERKEYPIDPSLPDIKNSIYSTDEFRMYSFKIRPCSRAYSHDWTECPFVHPGENARRRDPRKYHYSCVPCPDFRKGACRRGDLCEYAHGVFECWLHPAQYRTRLCKDGIHCTRRVCFFAHTPDELRPLYVSTGSAVPSPRSSASSSMDFASAINFLPGSPSAFTPPMSPSASNNGISLSSLAWPHPDVPSLRLPGSNLHSSRLRSSLNARDIAAEEFDLLQDYDLQQQLSEFSCLSMNPNSLNRSSSNHRSKTLNPSNLDDLFCAESSSSPRYNDHQALASPLGYSPTRKSAVFNQFQQQGMLSPINTSFSGRMSPRSVEPISPLSGRASMLAQREQQQLHQFRSLSSRDLGSNLGAIMGSPGNSWSRWGSSSGKPDWAVSSSDEQLGNKLRRSSSFELGNNGDQEPDLSWVQSLVKESPTEVKEKVATVQNSSMGDLSSNLNPLSDSSFSGL